MRMLLVFGAAQRNAATSPRPWAAEKLFDNGAWGFCALHKPIGRWALAAAVRSVEKAQG